MTIKRDAPRPSASDGTPEAGASPRGRLLLVGNREPYARATDEHGELRFERRAGGLVTALDPVMRATGGVWFAWDPRRDPTGGVRRDLVPEDGPRFTLARVPLSAEEVRRYYRGFANSTLWPLLHYFLESCRYEEADWDAYRRVNARFAKAVVEEAAPDDVIWVHDYHFCLLPGMVREQRPGGGPLVFFLHVPFPAEEVFRALPWRVEILEGLLGADLVGFHTRGYAENFLDCCERVLLLDVDREASTVHIGERAVRVGVFPIGIEVDEFEEIAGRPETQVRVRELREGVGTRRLVLGVDRLDYSKGILERVRAVERLFETHPEHIGRTTFLQVAVPSRNDVKQYADLKSTLDEMVGRVNGRFGEAGWQPVVYLYRCLEREDLVAHYRAADVALVTPLRDGMNLVAKEYAASRIDDDGVLVLSEFAGAAEGLQEGALIVNPLSVPETCAALARALSMETDERQHRMRSLRAAVRSSSVDRWLDSILRAATGRGAAAFCARADAGREAGRPLGARRRRRTPGG